MPILSTKHICGKGWHLNLNGNYELGQSVLFDVSLTQKVNNNSYHCGEELFSPLGLLYNVIHKFLVSNLQSLFQCLLPPPYLNKNV